MSSTSPNQGQGHKRTPKKSRPSSARARARPPAKLHTATASPDPSNNSTTTSPATSRSTNSTSTAAPLTAHAIAAINRPGTNFMRKTDDAELAFVRRYIVDFNGTRSVMECGMFQVASYAGAAVHASRLLSRPRVKQMVKDALAERAKRWNVTGDRIIRELARTGFSNMLDYMQVQPDGSAYVDLRKLAELREHDPDAAYDLGAAIQEVTSETYLEGNGNNADDEPIQVKKVKLRLHNKQAALELLGKHLGLFQDAAAKLPPNVTFNVAYVQDNGRNQQLLNDTDTDNNSNGRGNGGNHGNNAG